MSNLNPLLEFDNQLYNQLYNYFNSFIYPKIKPVIIPYALKLFNRAMKHDEEEHKEWNNFKFLKINRVEDNFGLDIDYKNKEKKIYIADLEGCINYTSKDDYRGIHSQNYYFQTIILFNTNGWYKIEEIFLGS